MNRVFQLFVLVVMAAASQGFVPIHRASSRVGSLYAETTTKAGNVGLEDADEVVARRIIVKGDVQGGYYRSCVLNEVG